MVFIITTGARDASGVLWVETGNVIIHPTMYRKAIQRVQHVDSVEVGKRNWQ